MMATLATPPAPAASPQPEVQETLVRRLTLTGVPWRLYDELLTVVGDGLPRLTYDRGTLELEVPSQAHEQLKWIAGRCVEAWADSRDLDYAALGSTTWRREADLAGLEADESYYFQNFPLIRGREIDLAVDPPPDLAIEIDLTPPGVEKESVYARLGVPEIWRWRAGRLAVLVRRGEGDYQEHGASIALTDFPLDRLATALGSYIEVEQVEAVRRFRRWCRESAATRG